MTVLFVAPAAEYFDRWDAPGLGNDTEFGLFLFVFFLCLVLVVALHVATEALQRHFLARLVPLRVASLLADLARMMALPVPPHNPPPLGSPPFGLPPLRI